MAAYFVASVARFYHRETAFTALIGFGAAMTVGFNIRLEQDGPRRFWVWCVLGNAGLVYAPSLLRPV